MCACVYAGGRNVGIHKSHTVTNTHADRGTCRLMFAFDDRQIESSSRSRPSSYPGVMYRSDKSQELHVTGISIRERRRAAYIFSFAMSEQVIFIWDGVFAHFRASCLSLKQTMTTVVH